MYESLVEDIVLLYIYQNDGYVIPKTPLRNLILWQNPKLYYYVAVLLAVSQYGSANGMGV